MTEPTNEMEQVKAEAKRNIEEAYRQAIESGSSVATAMEGIIFYAQEVMDLAQQYIAKDMQSRSNGPKQ